MMIMMVHMIYDILIIISIIINIMNAGDARGRKAARWTRGRRRHRWRRWQGGRGRRAPPPDCLSPPCRRLNCQACAGTLEAAARGGLRRSEVSDQKFPIGSFRSEESCRDLRLPATLEGGGTEAPARRSTGRSALGPSASARGWSYP
jgi:hypothetical protein